ncbi:MAG: hypothetical protein Kow0099_29270 [Candidatus Abyssubacteria bacterium]
MVAVAASDAVVAAGPAVVEAGAAGAAGAIAGNHSPKGFLSTRDPVVGGGSDWVREGRDYLREGP